MHKEVNEGIEAGAKVITEAIQEIFGPGLPDHIISPFREAFEKALNAAFATGSVGFYIKDKGKPKPVPDCIVDWLTQVTEHVDKLKDAGQFGKTNETRILLQLNNYALTMLEDARKNNGQ